MKAKEQTLAQLLDGPVVHVTPSFQRPYAGADGGAAAAMAADALAPDPAPRLLGALVTRGLAGRDGVRKALLIDGNQRLSTLLLLLLALRDRLRASGAVDEAARIDDGFFLNPGAPSPLRFKSLVGKADRAVFEAAAEGRPLPSPSHPMALALARASAAFAPLGADETAALARRLPGAFSFVVFELAPDDDPYPVFKLFNARNDRASRIGLDTYRQFSVDPELMDLVAGGESQEVEFKAHAVVPNRERKGDGPHEAQPRVGPVLGLVVHGELDAAVAPDRADAVAAVRLDAPQRERAFRLAAHHDAEAADEDFLRGSLGAMP